MRILLVASITLLIGLGGCAHQQTAAVAKTDREQPLLGDCRAVKPSKSQLRPSQYGNARCYNSADISRTGSIDVSDALRKLDPSIH
jgi:hypothetical protein